MWDFLCDPYLSTFLQGVLDLDKREETLEFKETISFAVHS